MFRIHCVKTYSQTQETVALMSWNTEFQSIVKAAAMGFGIKGLLKDLGVVEEVQVNADSSTAKRIATRRSARRL